jgi:glycosyltransferase involved in cell wall biosynthesis
LIDVSVVVPVYHNAETLGDLHARVATALKEAKLTHELILVDDACTAGSARVIDDLARSDEKVRAVHLAKNSGQHRALLAGLRIAQGRWAVFMDADLQDPPEAIPTLIEEGERGNPVVFAGRRGRYESRSRMLSAKVYRTLLHFVSGLPRDAGAFIAINRETIDRLLALRGPAPFIPTMIWCTGMPLTSIPIERSLRPRGASSYSSFRRLGSARRAFAWILWKRIVVNR